VEALIDELEAAREEVAGLVGRPHGRLRVTACSAFGQVVLAPMTPSFHDRYPETELEIVLADEVLDLAADRIDLVVRLGPRPTGDLVAAQLAPTAKLVVASPAYLRRTGPIEVPTDLSQHPCLLFPLEGSRSTQLFRGPTGEDTAVDIAGRLMSSNAMVLRAFAPAGLGAALVADWLIADDVAAGRLVRLLPEWTAAAQAFDMGAWVAYPSHACLPQKTRVFSDPLRAAYAARTPAP
jgi:DNA-binding transcriptional LysR family regulator